MARSAKAIPVLMYHHVSPSPGLVTVSPDTFDQHMQLLQREGWYATTCDELQQFLASGRELPEKTVLVTFDDGYLDNYVYAYPTLKKYGLRATLFTVTGWVGEGEARPVAGDAVPPPDCPDHKACKKAVADGRMDEVIVRWSELRRMTQAGVFEVHSHTHTHTRWDKTEPANRLQHMSEEFRLSRIALQQQLGQGSHHLCWPQGYFEPDYVRLAVAAGFDCLYTTEKSLVTWQTDPKRIGRVVVKEASASWLSRRLWLYSHPLAGGLYLRLRGQ